MAIMMLIAGLSTVICHLLRQPIVLGYILAGIIIGPHTPPFSFISDVSTVKTLAELGVIFLMFSLGLEFNLHKLAKVGMAAIIASIFEIVLMIALGYGIGRLFGWTQIDSIFLGAILSISSTTIIIKVLNELNLKKQPFAQLIFGILIIEDIFAILILALLSSIAMTGSLQVNEIVFTTLKLSSFLVISLLAGILIVPKLLFYIAKFNSKEMLLITVLALCFGFCLLVVELDYSIALGAFIIGAIIAESRELKKIENLINPLRDMFSAIFFVSIGLLFDLNLVGNYIVPIIVITIAVIVGKVLSCSLGILITGRDGKTAMRAGMGLAQIGEFSFIIASLGITLNVTGNFLYTIAVGVSIITTLTTPFLIKYSDSVAEYAKLIVPKGLANTFGVYTTWMQNIHVDENQEDFKRIIKRSIANIIINLFVVTAIFLGGSYIASTEIGGILAKITNIYIQKTIIWAFALIISLPFLIAVYSKIKALSMLMAELSVEKNVNGKLTANVRKIISELIRILSIFCIMIFISLLSVSILPPIELLFIDLAVVTILIILLSPWLVKLHSKLQAALIKSIKKK